MNHELLKDIRQRLGQIAEFMIEEDFYYASIMLGVLIGRIETIQEGKDGSRDQKD